MRRKKSNWKYTMTFNKTSVFEKDTKNRAMDDGTDLNL